MVERKAPTGTITGVEAMRCDWRTPPHLIELVARYFGGRIPYDAATNDENSCNALEFSTADGLEREWPAGTWCNPPYGRVIRKWLRKMSNEAGYGKQVIALLPCARWEQGYFMDAMSNANAICLVRKRVNFINPVTGDAVSGNPYANMFVGWNVDQRRFAEVFSECGQVYEWGLLRRRADSTEGRR